jgi:hypothetical protein
MAQTESPPHSPRGYHDIGGEPAGPIEKRETVPADWAILSEALRNAVHRRHGNLTLDELRRTFETMGKELYGHLGFYERRAEALARMLEEKGVLTRAEIEARMEAIARARGQVVDHAARVIGSAPR